jgi:hypothetical protein
VHANNPKRAAELTAREHKIEEDLMDCLQPRWELLSSLTACNKRRWTRACLALEAGRCALKFASHALPATSAIYTAPLPVTAVFTLGRVLCVATVLWLTGCHLP